MRLTLLDLPTSRRFAVDEQGVVWLRYTTGTWGRGCVSPDGERHVFLPPGLAVGFASLTRREHEHRFFNPDRKEPPMRQLVRQGDVLIVPIDEVPANVTPVPRENGANILAHGEVTGHAHRILEESAELVTAEGAAELYLLVNGEEPVALTHDEHTTIMVPPGAYEVRRQREYAPEENRLVAD